MSSGITKILPSNGSHMCPQDIQELPVNIPGNQRDRESANSRRSAEDGSPKPAKDEADNKPKENYSGQVLFNWQVKLGFHSLRKSGKLRFFFLKCKGSYVYDKHKMASKQILNPPK